MVLFVSGTIRTNAKSEHTPVSNLFNDNVLITQLLSSGCDVRMQTLRQWGGNPEERTKENYEQGKKRKI
jgi:hypothetical protein